MAVKKRKRSASKSSFQLRWWHYFLLLLIPLAVYARTLSFGYVMHDDDKMILENPALDEGIDVPLALRTDAWFMDARIELYRPWQSISYMVDHAIAGDHALVYRLHNLVIFLAGIFLLFLFLRHYLGPVLSWVGALLYSLNLMTPHAVGWIAARGDLYLMVFGLLLLICIQQYLRKGSTTFLWLSLPFFFLALMSKESAVGLIPVSLVMIFMEKKKIPSPAWIWLVLSGGLFAGYFALRSGAIADAGNMSAIAFLQNLRSLPEELLKMIIPVGFSVMPGYSIIWTLAGTLLLLIFLLAIWKIKPDPRILWTGAALSLTLLLPSMAYEPSFAGVAYDYLDHRTRLPFVGVWMIILGIANKLQWEFHKWTIPAAAMLAVIWGGINVYHAGVYQNWQSYYTNAIKTNPGSGLANLNYGSLLRDEGNWDEALPYIEKGVELSPDYVDAKVRLAEAYYNLKRYNEAIVVSTAALEKEPMNVAALQFRGSAHGASGKTEAAAMDFKKILETDPENHHGIFNLGIAYKDANMLNEAIETFSKLILLNPDFPNAYFERGFCYGKMGLFAQAFRDLDTSVQKQPEHGPSFFFRGRSFEAMGNLNAACLDWRKALELGTTDAQAYIDAKCQ